jgi:hypothetical protein
MRKHWAAFRDWFLSRGLRWSLVARFMRTRISQAAATIPLIGYALLWSSEIERFMQLRPALGGDLWFSPTQRLLLLYVGAHLLTLAWLIYLWRCPSIIRSTPDVTDYLGAVVTTNNRVEYDRVRTLMELKFKPSTTVTNDFEWVQDLTTFPLRSEFTAREVEEVTKVAHGSPLKTPMSSLLIQAWFHFNDGRNPITLFMCAALLTAGSIAVVLPSIEVLIRVIKRILLPALGL